MNLFSCGKRNTWSSFASDKLLRHPSINYNFNNLQIVYCIFQVEHEGKFVMKWSAFFLTSKYNFQLTTVKYKSARFNFSFQQIQETIMLQRNACNFFHMKYITFMSNIIPVSYQLSLNFRPMIHVLNHKGILYQLLIEI